VETIKTSLPGVILLKPKAFQDSRGFFLESWQDSRYKVLGIPDGSWAQDNVSSSSQGVLRGLHFQYPNSQGKLISVLDGEIFDVAVDIRWGSPTFGKSFSTLLSSSNLHQLWIPKGFAHGFLVKSGRAIVSYKASDFYLPENEKTLLWNDPHLGIDWPLQDPPILSTKDIQGVPLHQIPKTLLPSYSP